jgi:hypothetical protein
MSARRGLMAIAKEKGKVEQLQEFYDSILEERSQRLGISLEDAAKLANDQPRKRRNDVPADSARAPNNCSITM